MMEKITQHCKLPLPNWCHEQEWYDWYKTLYKLIDNDTPEDVSSYIKSIEHPEMKHWSRWLMWYEDLVIIVGSKTS